MKVVSKDFQILFFNGKVSDILNMSDCELLNILLRQLEREGLEN